MSGKNTEWGVGGLGDTCNVVISIPGLDRTDPPDKLRSGSDEATQDESRSLNSSRRQTERALSAELTAWDVSQDFNQQQRQEQPPTTSQQQQQPQCSKHQQHHVKPEKHLPKHQVWIANQFSLQHGEPGQTNDQDNLVPTLASPEKDVSSAVAHDVFNSHSSFTEITHTPEFDYALRRNNVTDSSAGTSPNHVNCTNNFSEASSASCVSPRLKKCLRQHRVTSSDELPTDLTNSDRTSIHDLPQLEDGTCFQEFVNGSSHQFRQSLNKVEDSKLNSDIFTPCEVSKCFSNGLEKDSTAPVQCDVNIRKRLSLDTIPVVNSDQSGTFSFRKSWSSRYKKKEADKKSGPNVDATSGRVTAVSEPKENLGRFQKKEDGGSVQQASTNGAKGSRRLAKRGLGMFPSSNWRRLRNTLKAANEMQSSRKQRHGLNREDSFLRKFSTRNHQNVQNANSSIDGDSRRSWHSSSKVEGRFVIQHDGNFMFYWLGVVTISVLYNLWTCIAREAFREIQEGCPSCWYSFDALFDFIYICDILVQFRTGYLDQGLMVYDSKKLRQKYTKSRVVYIDFVSLLPLDLIQFFIGVHPMVRFPRFLKIYRPFRFLHMLESRTAYPNLIRVANLTHILFLGAHWFAAFYYMISEAEGFTGEWSYPLPVGDFANVNRKYLRSLFWSTLTLTTIGDIPPPCNSKDLRMSNAAYVFVIVSYLIGVFVFATIVGQVGNVINNRNASRQEFERLLDGAKIYMQTHNVPHNLQKRVQRWYDYVWSRGRLNGCDINSLGLLPDKLKTELAIHVNLETLKKVTIFQECQPEFLHDLVLKMKAYIFTPGDLICRRGEVAREMFIIADGVVEIISESGVMLKRMGAGDFFGEIGILNLDGGINRRTADVRSVGYLELFVLSREDVLAALKDHPEAESIIRDYGQRRLREVEAHRQKVKPLKCRGSTTESGNLAGTPQTVPNRLLQTLRSLNPAVRRQSSQANHVGSPPMLIQTGSPTDLQRCVNQRGSPVNKPVSGLAKASSNAQSGLAIVSLDRTDFSTAGRPNRLPEEYSQRRQSFAYFKTAYARFKNVFPRRKSQRQSIDVSDNRKRELCENRLLFKSTSGQSTSVDLSVNSNSFSPGCNVRLNIEDCSESIKLTASDSLQDSDGTDNESTNRIEKSMLSTGVKRGSVLFPGFSDVEPGKHSQNFGRIVQRKFSEPVTYMPVCTEDLDEKFMRRGPENVKEEELEDNSPTFQEVDKSSQFSPRKTSVTNEPALAPNSNSGSLEPLKLSSLSLDIPSCAFLDKSFISNSGKEHDDNVEDHDDDNYEEENNNDYDDDDDDDCHSVKNKYSNANNADLVSCRTINYHECPSSVGGQYENIRAQLGERSSSLQNETSEPKSCPGTSQDSLSTFLPQYKSFSSFLADTTASTLSSNSHELLNRASSVTNHVGPATRDPSETQFNRRHSGCVFHINVAQEDPNSSTSLLTASPSPFTLSCHCDPAENFKKYIGCHFPKSLHNKLNNRNNFNPRTVTSSNPRSDAQARTQKSSSTESPQRTTTLSPSGCPQTGRSLSFPTLTEPKDGVRNSGDYGFRRQSSQVPDHFIFDDVPVCLSPKVAKLKQEECTPTKFNWSGNGGRSHAMSIIQQPTTDFTYQQLTEQINIMQGMLEKRLTLLEEAYSSTTEKLEYLATSQDLLVQLLRQHLVPTESQECIQFCSPDKEEEEEDRPAASVI